ncbi:MAG: trypsin-like serine protease [Deltaproteobacteria bacterium]|nr:MAG: trypsin-like serine protease [Deltaproteobacteria bacterium]TMQ19914.1 MAG: trypsin-like serine protease [Deltaproteobacteria bacterium]
MLQFISTVLITSSLSTPHVVGGTPVKPGTWPDAVAVLAADAACTGTLIAPDVVLTAGHCIDTHPVVVVVDTVDYGRPGGEPIRVAHALAYPDWQHSYDVGVVVLEHPAKARPRAIAAACMVRSGLVEGAMLHLVGFGLISRAGTGDNSRLHEGQIPVVDATCTEDPACNPAVAPGGEFTAGGDGVDSCFGDSGGPVYLDTTAGPALVGVVSRAYATGGPPCGNGGVYVRADKVVSWIERVTHEKLARTACKGAADEGATADEPAGQSGGCAAGGSGAGLLLAVGAVGLAVRRRRSAGAQPSQSDN